MKKDIQITFLTDPILFSKSGAYRILRWLSAFTYTVKLGWKNLKYGGHPGVTRSVLWGMKSLGVRHNYNPVTFAQFNEIVVVLSSVRALRQAIQMKRAGKIKLLIAGPNVLDIPTDQEAVLEDLAIDFCLVPSKWRADMYHVFSTKMNERVFAWPSGVDTTYWKPHSQKSKDCVILYLKNKSLSDSFIIEVEKYLKANFHVEIIQYGEFEREDFKNILNRAKFLVGITSGSETQGLVWAEAWAMDVPTFIYNNQIDIVRGKTVKISSAPYIANENGAFFESLLDLEAIIRNYQSYRPRDWVLENMSDVVSSQKLLGLISDFKIKKAL